jgi:hypothetical protein
MQLKKFSCQSFLVGRKDPLHLSFLAANGRESPSWVRNRVDRWERMGRQAEKKKTNSMHPLKVEEELEAVGLKSNGSR